MTLSAELFLPKSEILIQENPLCRLTLQNLGREPISTLHRRLPLFRLIDVRTGHESISAPHRPDGHGPRVDIASGESVTSHFLFLERRDPIPSAEYEISAIYGEGVESKPQRIRVRPATPKNLTLDTVQGGVSFGVWVNLASDPPRIVRSRFDLWAGGGVGETLSIAPAGARTKPSISLPPNRADRSDPWIAWIDGPVLRTAHLSEIQEVKLAGPNGRVVSPIIPGAALIWVDETLQCVRLGSPAERSARIELPGPPPEWMMSHARSNGSRAVTLIQSSPPGIALLSAPWSEKSIGPFTRLHDWKGTFVAAGATLGLDDVLRGAVILSNAVVAWEIDQAGTFHELERWRIPRSDSKPIAKASVRVSGWGVVAALLRDEAGEWTIFSRGGRIPLPAAVAKTVLPIEVAFLGKAEPILICAIDRSGFRILRMDGRPL